MTNIILLISIVVSMLGLSAISLFAGIKFLRIWRLFREESLFHLGVLFLDFIVYMLFLIFIILVSEDPEISNLLLKRFLGVIYSFLALEMSLFYLTTFINRRNLWEKYIPYTLGATFGVALTVMIIQDTDPWYNLLLVIVYILPFLPISFLVVKVVKRTYRVYKDPQMTRNDKNFVMAIGFGSVFMFAGSLFDMVFFWIIITTKINFWESLIFTGGILAPFFLIIVVYIIKKLFKNIEEADVIHLMNLLS